MTDILIFDDDSAVAGVSREMLLGAGYSVEQFDNSLRVLELTREKRPRLVLMDVMMPGMDGISACKCIKADPLARESKVAIVTARPEKSEKERALSNGADGFIQKPYGLATLLQEVARLIGSPRPSAPPLPAGSSTTVTCWGSGGAAEGCCVSVEHGRELFLLDAGAGLFKMGSRIASSRFAAAHVFIAAYRPGHFEGLAGSQLMGDAGLSLSLYGPNSPESSVEDFAAKHLPGASRVKRYALYEGRMVVSSAAAIRAIYTNAPGTTLAFRLELGARSVVYCPDSEITGSGKMEDYREKLKDLCRGADVLIHNARYTPEDYSARQDEGDSSSMAALELALESGVQRLALFKMDPAYPSVKIEQIMAKLRDRLSHELTTLELAHWGSGESVSI